MFKYFNETYYIEFGEVLVRLGFPYGIQIVRSKNGPAENVLTTGNIQQELAAAGIVIGGTVAPKTGDTRYINAVLEYYDIDGTWKPVPTSSYPSNSEFPYALPLILN